MALFTFWYGDNHTTLDKTSNITIQKEFDVTLLVSLMNLDTQKIERRFQDGNEAWLVKLEDQPVSFGWLCRGKAGIGELSKEIEVPNGNAYLWNFRTLEPYRGRGYYAQLLSTILLTEEKFSERIWVISAPENQSSYNGIVKAGFQNVGEIIFNTKNEVVLMATSVSERTHAGADLIQIPITTTAGHPCWRCSSKSMKKEASCECHKSHLPCRCSNQNLLRNALTTVQPN